MAKKIKNLTTPQDIDHAFLMKDGRSAMSRFADASPFSRAYLSMNVHGYRRNKELLQLIANHLGCGVYGVMPSNKRPEAARKEGK